MVLAVLGADPFENADVFCYFCCRSPGKRAGVSNFLEQIAWTAQMILAIFAAGHRENAMALAIFGADLLEK